MTASDLQSTNIQRIGIFGGTFDPVHLGHLLIAQQALEQFSLTQIRWIPAATAPHEQLKNSSPAMHRLAMLQLAICGNPQFVCDDCELKRGGKSYTIDTLKELAGKFPESEFVLLIGADSLREFSKWRSPDEICRMARVVVVHRGGQQPVELTLLTQFLPTPKPVEQLQREHLLIMPQVEISSSDIRQRVQQARSIRYQVPAAVEAYIAEHNLYQASQDS